VQGPFVGLFVFTHEPLHDGPLQRQQRPSQARKHTTTRDVTFSGAKTFVVQLMPSSLAASLSSVNCRKIPSESLGRAEACKTLGPVEVTGEVYGL